MDSSQYHLLLQCYRSGQVSERQWQAHLEDADFRSWMEAQSDGWINWNGGDRPLPVLQKVEIETREGRRYTNYAGAYIWGHIGFFDDIVRYRVVAGAT